MKHTLPLLAFLLVLTLGPVHAQHHPPTDSDRSALVEQMQHMMQMHEHMMADPVLHQHMVADTSMQATMREMMGPEVAAMHEQMAAMPLDERMAMQQQMHASMMGRMEAMSPEEFQAFHERMMAAHRRMMDDPEVRERMMADPQMREMMERMHEDGMMHHDGMRHDEMHERMHDGASGTDG